METTTTLSFKQQIKQGIPNELPPIKAYDNTINHAPKRKEILSKEEKKLAIANALRYFKPEHHEVLAKEFSEELNEYGRIYMYRFRPDYEMKARPIKDYPGKSKQAKAIMLMIQNNLDYAVAQHPHELITYGGNGGVFSNWAQYLLTMKYLSEMTDKQTLVMYSGHPMGYLVRLFQYRNRREAYRNVSFEREAYNNETNLEYIKKRPIWAFLKYV